jgi:twitching motility protein PilT
MTDDRNQADFSYDIKQFLQMTVNNNASDLIIKAGSAPGLRIEDEIHKVNVEPLTPEQALGLAKDFLSDDIIDQVINQHEEYDGAYSDPELGRFRVNVFLQRESVGMVFRPVEDDIPTFESLNLPDAISRIPNFERGLVLVTGTTSTGKSTTLASIIDYINRNMKKHIVTIEDPIEYLHDDKQSIVSQREVGVDTKDFSSALKYVLRQNPDVILFGELRDRETVRAAFEAAETGHLVLSTLHTKSASNTIERILKFFPAEQNDQIRALISDYFRAICSQRLCQRSDTDGLIPAVELMFNSPMISKLIKEDRLDQIRSAIHQNRENGMQTFDQNLVELCQQNIISEDEGRKKSSNPEKFDLYLEDHWPDIETGVLGDSNL